MNDNIMMLSLKHTDENTPTVDQGVFPGRYVIGPMIESIRSGEWYDVNEVEEVVISIGERL